MYSQNPGQIISVTESLESRPKVSQPSPSPHPYPLRRARHYLGGLVIGTAGEGPIGISWPLAQKVGAEDGVQGECTPDLGWLRPTHWLFWGHGAWDAGWKRAQPTHLDISMEEEDEVTNLLSPRKASPDGHIFTCIHLPPKRFFEAAHKSKYSLTRAFLTWPAGLYHWKQFTSFYFRQGVILYMSSIFFLFLMDYELWTPKCRTEFPIAGLFPTINEGTLRGPKPIFYPLPCLSPAPTAGLLRTAQIQPN